MVIRLLFLVMLLILVGCKTEERVVAPTNNGNTTPIQEDVISMDPFKTLYSGIFRDRGSEQITIHEESQAALVGLSYAYHNIPDVEYDDEGFNSSSVIIKALRPSTNCGYSTGLDTIAKKIAECADKNTFSSWDGAEYGIAGEGQWQLVVKHSSDNEVWLDKRTNLLWSDNLGGTHWCNASGNQQDLFAIDCATLHTKSYCQDNNYKKDQKGRVGNIVSWRLPTRADYFQAELGGIRFVLRDMNKYFWTATIHSGARNQAWTFVGNYGTISNSVRSATNRNVRCIGRFQQ